MQFSSSSFQTFTVKSVQPGRQRWGIKRGPGAEWSQLRPGDAIDARRNSIRYDCTSRKMHPNLTTFKASNISHIIVFRMFQIRFESESNGGEESAGSLGIEVANAAKGYKGGFS